jgi:hypothetical protein
MYLAFRQKLHNAKGTLAIQFTLASALLLLAAVSVADKFTG